MSRVHAASTAIIHARADVVYNVLADYRNSHPHILPQPYFSGVEVEQGGTGAGTIFRTRVRVFGSEFNYHMIVTEPEPGRQLVETDLETGLATTFTVTPTRDGQQAQVTIGTEWEARPGIAGLIERLSTPPVMRMIYTKQLRQLAAYVQDTAAGVRQ